MSTTSPAAFAKALRNRRKRRLRRRFVVVAAALVVLLVLGIGIQLVFFSSLLAVKDVTITGNRLLTSQQLLDQAQVPTGAPLITVDVRGMTERLRELPEVADVRVERRYPNSLDIAVTERTAIFQRAAGNQFLWVDADGVSFHEAAEALPEVPLAVIVGDDAQLVSDVAVVVSALPEAVRPHLQRVVARSRDAIFLELDEGRQVVWGSAEQSELKAQVLFALVDVEAKVYDVSAPGHPTTK